MDLYVMGHLGLYFKEIHTHTHVSWIQTWVQITAQSLARLPHVLVEGQRLMSDWAGGACVGTPFAMHFVHAFRAFFLSLVG